MKNTSILFIAIVIVLFSVPKTYAQEGTSGAVLSPKAEYTLPYPGILPDSPFYFLKVTRDRIISFLISDSVKKAEFNLLQADKRLGAGRALVDKQNYALAQSTFSKGLNYLEEAIIKIQDAQKEGKDIKPLHEKLLSSIEEHNTIYTSIENHATGDFKKQMGVLLKRLGVYEKSAEKILPQR